MCMPSIVSEHSARSVMTSLAAMRRTQFAGEIQGTITIFIQHSQLASLDNLDLTMDVSTENHVLDVFLRHLPWTTFGVVPGPIFCRSVPTVPPTTVVVVKGLEFAATIAIAITIAISNPT